MSQSSHAIFRGGRNHRRLFLSLLLCGIVALATTAYFPSRSHAAWETAVAPVPAASNIGGKVTDANNNPRPGVYVTLSDGSSDATATDANGNYSFTNLDPSRSYTVTPLSEVFAFSPPNQAITPNQSRTDANFIASPLNANVNQIDASAFFVRQHYIDFLNREPDRPGLQFWVNEITSCNGNAQCIDIKRQNVSAAYFLSIEFQQTGFLVYQLYKASFGNITNKPVAVTFQQFIPDVQTIGNGVIVGQAGYEQQLENNKVSFIAAFVNRSAFITRYPNTLTPAQFVDALNANTGNTLSQGDRNNLVSGLTNGTQTRATVLRQIADPDKNPAFKQAEFNRAFVLMQYFGYLRRNPDDSPDGDFSGYNFWLNKLTQFNGDYIRSEMVRAFILSSEYRKRFGAQ